MLSHVLCLTELSGPLTPTYDDGSGGLGMDVDFDDVQGMLFT